MVISDSSDILPVAVVAVRTGLSESCLRRLARAGQLPGAKKIGRSWRVLWSKFYAWLQDSNPEVKP